MNDPTVAEALTEPALVADTPAAWLALHLSRRYGHSDEPGEPGCAQRGWTGLVELVDAGAIRDVHGGLVADGTPPKVASTYLASWFGGAIARAVGFGLAAGGAGFVTSPNLRVHVHATGWVDAVELEEPHVVVAAGHPWAGQHGVDVVASEEVLAGSVHALVETCAPIVDACRSLATVGRAGLWNEIGDALGSCLAYQDDIAPTPAMLAVLDAAVRVPGVPWLAAPSLRFVHSEVLGPVHIAQKGGCCLAYTVDRPAGDDGGSSRYCDTCSFRTPEDCDARRLSWLERTVPPRRMTSCAEGSPTNR
jgi:hypothetical protein